LLAPIALFAALILSIATLAVGVVRSFGLGPDSAALRDGLMKSRAASWSRQVEVGVGSLPVTLARSALNFVPLEPEVRSALQSFRGGEVGVYQRHNTNTRVDQSKLLEAADRTMSRRGWDRIVGVGSPGELVAVYVPHDLKSPRNVRVCVVVADREQLVIVSARSNLEPILQLASGRPEWNELPWRLKPR
jgi:hypothetical protein